MSDDAIHRAHSREEIASRILSGLAAPAADADETDRLLARAVCNEDEGLVRTLVSGWAELLHILDFYQDRVVEESSLCTARQDRSILELTDMLGVQPRPGLSATTLLSFTLDPDHEGNPQRVNIPAGTRVDSQGGVPQTFETSETVSAHTSWNEVTLAPDSTFRIPARLALPKAGSDDTGRFICAGQDPSIEPGAHLLVTEQAGARWWLLVATSVEKVSNGADQRVTFRVEHGSPGGDKTDAVEPAVSLLSVEASLFENKAWERQPELVGFDRVSPKEEQAATPTEARWTACPLDVLGEVRCLATNDEGRLFAGTRERGIFRSRDNGRTWERTSRGLMHPGVFDIKFSRRFGLLAGTDSGGIYRSTDGGDSWVLMAGGEIEERLIVPGEDYDKGPFTTRENISIGPAQTRGLKHLPTSASLRIYNPIRSVVVDDHRKDRSSILAGTDAGVLVSDNYGVSWWLESEGLPGYLPRARVAGVAVQCLVADPETRNVYAGTSQGLYAWYPRARQWAPACDELRGRDVRAICPLPGGVGVVVGTDTGLWKLSLEKLGLLPGATRSPGAAHANCPLCARSLSGVSPPAGSTDVNIPDGVWLANGSQGTSETGRVHQIVAFKGGGYVLAACDAGLFLSTDGGASWAAWNKGLLTQERWTVAVLEGADGAWEAFSAGPTREMTREEWPGAEPDQTTLDLDAVYPGLARGTSVVLRYPDSSPTPKPPILHRGGVEAVEVVRRKAQGLAQQTSRLRLGKAPVIGEGWPLDTQILCHPVPLPLKLGEDEQIQVVCGSVLVLQGRLPALEVGQRVLVGGRPLELQQQGSWAAVESVKQGSPNWTWTVGGEPIAISPETAEVRVAEAMNWEVCSVVSQVQGATTTTLTIAKDDRAGLQLAYDAATVRVLGNLSVSSHGRTVQDVVIGSGDRSVPGQRFSLQSASLSHTRDPATGEQVPELEVRVDRYAVWRPARREGRGRVYRIARRASGEVELRFGLGAGSERLPSGTNNVTATFREGSGKPGNLAAGSLVQLVDPPVGVASVRNPLPSRGGVDAETPRQMRAELARRLRTLDRIVTLSDLEDYLTTQPEIGACVVDRFSGAGREVLHVTAADLAGVPFDEDADALVIAAIERAALSAGLSGSGTLQIVGFEVVPLQVRLGLYLQPSVVQDEVADALRSAVLDRLQLSRGAFARAVSPSTFYAIGHEVPGVAGLALQVVSPKDVTQAPASATFRYQAANARQKASEILPAQIFTLEPEDLVIVQMEAM